MVKKLVRIVPLYWVLTVFMFVLIRIRPSLSLMSTASLPDLIRSLLFIPFVNEKGFRAPVFSLGWMLEYQMLFFILFSLSLAAGTKGACILARLRGDKSTASGVFRLRGVTAGIFLILFMVAAKDTFPLEFIYGIGIYYLYEAAGRSGFIKGDQNTGDTTEPGQTGGIQSLAISNIKMQNSGTPLSGKMEPEDGICRRSGLHSGKVLPVLISILCFCACILAECVTRIPRQYLLGILTALMIAFPLLMTEPVSLPPMVSCLAECSYEFILIEYFTTAFFKVISGGMPFPVRLALLALILGITFGISVIIHRLYGIFLAYLKKRIKTDQE